MITAYIFTRNRAAQLDLLLRSLRQNLPGVFEPYVVWRGDDHDFVRGYRRTMERHPYASWVEEWKGPREDMLDGAAYAAARSGLMALFTDDCVAWRAADVTAGDIRVLLRSDAVQAVSLRLGRNTVVQNYLTGEMQPPLESASPAVVRPDPLRGEPWLVWSYERFGFTQNFGYVAGMDGHVFRASDVAGWVSGMERMDTYRAWEGSLHLPQNRRKMAEARPRMACPETSCVVNVPLNSVQADPTPSGRQHPASAAELNRQFLAGSEIDLVAIPFGEVRSCHAEYPMTMRRP